MSDELKPCPFCGHLPQASGKAFNPRSQTVEPLYACQNFDCDARPCVDDMGGANVFRDDWNKRPVEDELRAKWESVPWRSICDLLWAIDDREPGAMVLKLWYDTNAPQEP